MPVDPLPTRHLRVTAAVACAVGIAVLAVLVTGLLRTHEGSTDGAGPPPSTSSRRLPHVSLTEAAASVAVLRDWDRARSRAWAHGDVPALRRLYLTGAVAGERDAAMLRAWVDRGLRVRGMSMQVAAVELCARTDRRIVLLVTDRLAGAVAVPRGGGSPRGLPQDGWTTRRLAFRRTPGGWVLAAAYDRPLASTAATSGSANS